jgi:hypothetical protein
MHSVTTGLILVLLGGGVLLLVAGWWSWAGNGISLPRERWPREVRLAAAAGWALFLAGIVVQLVGYFGQVGLAHFLRMAAH